MKAKQVEAAEKTLSCFRDAIISKGTWLQQRLNTSSFLAVKRLDESSEG